MGEEPEVSGTPDGLQFGVTRRGTIMVKAGSFSYVQPAEGDWRRALRFARRLDEAQHKAAAARSRASTLSARFFP